MDVTPPPSPDRKKILVIGGDSSFLGQAGGGFAGLWPGADIEAVPDVTAAVAKMRGRSYDLAVIDGAVKNPAFLSFAQRAAAESNMAVLVTSADPHLLLQLEIAGFPHLATPFGRADMRQEFEAAITDYRVNPQRLLASLGVAKIRIEALSAPHPGAHVPDAASACGACRNAASLPPLTMAFQPIVNLAAHAIDGHEALVRGINGEGAGQILAGLTAENRYAFDQACRVTAIEMAARLGVACDLHVNFMPNAMYDPVACLRPTLAAARRSGFPHERLVFEVMEQEVANACHLAAIVAAHRARNFKLALDDFGAGFSGLTRLAALRPDIVKLDRGLIGGCDVDAVRLEIVASVVGLCRRLGIKLIAEGVETAEELAALRKVGVNFVQGFYFARPAFQALVRIEDIPSV